MKLCQICKECENLQNLKIICKVTCTSTPPDTTPIKCYYIDYIGDNVNVYNIDANEKTNVINASCCKFIYDYIRKNNDNISYIYIPQIAIDINFNLIDMDILLKNYISVKHDNELLFNNQISVFDVIIKNCQNKNLIKKIQNNFKLEMIKHKIKDIK